MNKILIVDDEPNILLSLEYLFKKEGFTVYIARDGEEAMEIIDVDLPEIVILDIMMPKVDGYEVCKYIKEKNEAVKVVFLTAKSKIQDIEKGLETGADLYLTKPFTNKDLITKVRNLIN
ncbi:response regulator transcription factor [Belliella kenyensis]|uniref:Response regulator transcription factor n=1 Tax=Belliella kenyensis TaxID=1472724 RepID=A0ABV8EKA4_9BACT|nr:response regulator [Belliella kenyensis]MCH7403273.1 response regulator [Belliella kenyensis]MDN3602914.1 response regulator [Belliella kenyensis]